MCFSKRRGENIIQYLQQSQREQMQAKHDITWHEGNQQTILFFLWSLFYSVDVPVSCGQTLQTTSKNCKL